MSRLRNPVGIHLLCGLVLLVACAPVSLNPATATPASWQAASPSAFPLVDASPPPDCPLAYPGFCAFIASMNDLIVAGDIDGILEHTQQKICPDYDEVIDIGCHPGELYVEFGVIQGEGYALSVDRLRSTWAGAAEPPRQIRGLCDTPDVSACSQGPAILVRTSDDEWDWIFRTRQEGNGWIIHAISIQRRPYEDWQIPPEYVLPWPSP